MHEHGFQTKQLVPDRNAVFASVARKVRNERVLYLEFGVFEGASIRYWSRELQHPDSILHGFDSFEGLPEDFDVSYHYSLGKGAFSTQGRVPVIHDKRVKFFKGWFDQVLPGYSVPPHNVLVINMDADLYSSTLYVLRHLRKWIRCGTFIYFDEMSRLEHEPRAFEVFLRENKLSFRLVCADQSLNNAFFECIGEGAGGSQV
ncbi:MAG: TylF/MycF/NovP-related O-methyltransferase [Thermodesulfobacteriota bacterium]|nr:TylF/MycF/NovP-related O-methyltransferase [Thermodesulfobacteriota bacterium]